MSSPSVRRQVVRSLRSGGGLLSDFWPESGAGRGVAVLVLPVLLVVGFVAFWVAGVLLLSAVGSVVGSDILGSVKDWPKGWQAVLYVGVAAVTGGVVWLGLLVVEAVSVVRGERGRLG